MDLLPDDVLVQAMSLLSLPDLFQLRLACKRFAALALHPDVWRHRNIDFTFPGHRALLCPTLRLAPCFSRMAVCLPSHSCPHIFTTACAARQLSVYLKSGEGAMHGALVIRHQRDLGRLRQLFVYFETSAFKSVVGMSKVHFSMFFGALLSTPDLEYLHVGGTCAEYVPRESVFADIHCSVRSSLQSISLFPTPALEHVFNLVLGTHAATLKTLSFFKSIPSPSTVLLLAKMPHLSRLKSPMVPGIDALVACKSLRSITLHCCKYDVAEATAATAELLRHAHQLQIVDLDLRQPWLQSSSIATELVTALASSGRSCVESLCIHKGPRDRFNPQRMQELLSALSSLPALLRLHLEVVKNSDDGRALLALADRADPSRPLDVQLGMQCVLAK